MSQAETLYSLKRSFTLKTKDNCTMSLLYVQVDRKMDILDGKANLLPVCYVKIIFQQKNSKGMLLFQDLCH